jgi:phage terminase large subunit-like protein
MADYHWKMMEDLDKLTAGEYKELLWVMFRESAKTAITKAYITWNIAYSKKHYINVDSYDKDNAEGILFDVAIEMQTNKNLIADFGNLYNEDRSINEKTKKRVTDFITSNKIRVEAHSTQEPVRGRTYGEYRPDLLIMDDIETKATVRSQAAMEQVRGHIKEFYGGLSPDHRVIYLGNYITEYGVIQELMKRAETDPTMQLLFVPVAEEDNGKINWASKYVWTDEEANLKNKTREEDRPLVSLEAKKRQMGEDFWAEMMNQPIDCSLAEFKRDWFKYVPYSEVNKLITNCYVTIDTAVSQKDSADFTGITLTWIDTDGKRYIKSYHNKMNPAELIEHMFYLDQTYRPVKIGVEETVYLMAIKPFIDEEMRKRNIYFFIEPLKHKGINKETRIRGLIPMYMSGSIYHVEGECEDLEGEMLRFPNAKHDDILDSLAYTIDFVEKPFTDTFFQQEESPLYADIGI